jgi:DNA-binding response OmpR family regulator/nitrogen-specific signal transduction histidine kinase
MIYLTLAMLAVWEMMNLLIRRKIRSQEHFELEKKEMKIRMFTDISHEIRTPFSLIMSPLKSMLETEADPKRKEMLNLMYRNVLRILRLLNQLMDIRKIDNHQFQLQFQKTDLILFLNDVMKLFEQLAILRNIEFRLITHHETLEAWIDQVNFDKVLFNILSNAFKFTPDNGYILISLKTVKNDHSTGLKIASDEVIELRIENSGDKIDKSETDHIFERFYQGNNNRKIGGTGVGLHLTQKIVDLHSGHIYAKNTDNGVAFIVNLPLGNKHLSTHNLTKSEHGNTTPPQPRQDEYLPEQTNFNEQPLPTNWTNAKGSKSKRSLVVVDDDADFGQYISMELGEKYHIEFFTRAKDAWKVISTKIPDAVITDLMMPEVDGISLCKKIRQNPETIHLPVIILTAETDEESETKCIECGADHYLTKPINLELFKITVAQAIQTRETIKNKYKANISPDFEDIIIASHDGKLMAKVLDSIRQNIENPEFNVDDLSREVGISRGHLNRKLKENLNISPSNLIRSIRLKQAAYLLINNKVNISDVAYKVGFSSHSYFSNNFKEYFGMAPTEFVTKYTGLEDKESLNKLFEV